jgi:hypothetical protein
MFCCWISPDHDSVSTQRWPRSGYRAAPSMKSLPSIVAKSLSRESKVRTPMQSFPSQSQRFDLFHPANAALQLNWNCLPITGH